MPWRSPMSAKEALIFDVNEGMNVSDAADKHGVARSCAYKWMSRFKQHGWPGLEELSRRPELSPTRTEQELVEELLGLKKKHPAFGPAKLVPMLDQRHGKHVMAVSTAGEILLRHGLVQKRRPRQRSPGRIEHSPYEISGAGDSMTADYKGQFSDGQWSTLLSADGGRSIQPLRVGHRCDGLHAHGHGQDRIRTSLP